MASGRVKIDIPCDVQQVDDTGYVWAFQPSAPGHTMAPIRWARLARRLGTFTPNEILEDVRATHCETDRPSSCAAGRSGPSS